MTKGKRSSIIDRLSRSGSAKIPSKSGSGAKKPRKKQKSDEKRLTIEAEMWYDIQAVTKNVVVPNGSSGKMQIKNRIRKK